MRVPKKTILAVALALILAACAESGRQAADDEKLSKKEWQAYRDSVMDLQLDSIVWWIDSTYQVLLQWNRRIDYLFSLHEEAAVPDSIPREGDDPPPPPCPGPPDYCPW